MSSSTFSPAAARPTKAWHVTLWIVQILLALIFALAGAKAATPMPVLLQKMAWVGSVPSGLVRFHWRVRVRGRCRSDFACSHENQPRPDSTRCHRPAGNYGPGSSISYFAQ